MIRTELIALARKTAAAQQLPAELVCAVCEQESSWNPWALRYEYAFFQKYVLPQWANSKLPTLTEAQSRAFSWGLMQVIGQTAREHGFEGAFLCELCEPATGLEIGCRVLAVKITAAGGNIEKALLLWNGGANPNYAAQVLARTAHYRSGDA